ncbi:CubicO group peptidase, beta-lactamase class C family [Paenibacillus uliginis N3/975]|uniref:CubicO group peptidase, beta-lactamase class C family n=1 Tax=Paenibacillus uliginis N3/975 TaxID=1313296 RepID=A0A1X7HG25_9BACL|nr:serine hydrolase domain-containing protein [Paenibacillus uliginis]SMF85229.1 CubicO group peptidase, beta-lactamase class C family [Paenibacillus uliginis N3/975]
MKKRLSWVLSATLALTMIAPTGAMASSVAPTVVASQGLKKIAAENAALLIESTHTISVQYALIDNGKITVSGHTGKDDEPLTKDTLYGIGSVSKVFGAAAVMKLVDEGKIDLDTPVVQYITDFKMKDERYKRITPRMLLNHSSGLRGTGSTSDSLFEDNDSYAHDTILQTLSDQTLKADPGAFSVYSNSGFTLAEILVERVSGMSFTEFLHQYFTKPLQMNHTKTPQDKLKGSKLARFYVPDYQEQLPDIFVNVIAEGGINSTAEDMVRFSQIFMGQANHILSDKSVRAMEQEEYKKGIWPEDTDDSNNYGLGWDSVKLYPFNDYGIKGLAKGGDISTYAASLVVLPEKKMAAAVLSSGGSSSTNQLLASEMLLLALKEKGEIKNVKPDKSFGKPVKAKMPNDVVKQAGYYASSNTQSLVEITKDGELSMANDPETKYIYTSDGSFINENGTSKVSFVTEKNGRTYLWKRAYETLPGLGQLATSEYAAEKLEDNVLPKETAEAWAKREGAKFYVVNQKFSSEEYFFGQLTIEISLADGLPGYWEDRKITGPNTATSQIQIPGIAGRDTTEARFYTKDGIEYLNVNGYSLVSEANVKPIYAGNQSKATVSANGDAKWYTIPAAAAGKTMTVKLPTNGAFAVYDEQGSCISYSLVYGNNKLTLPKNGTIVFAGEPGSKFKIAMK